MKILYAGDSPAGGAANYLLGILKSLKADLFHLAPSEILKARFLQKKYDAFILSDFSRKNLPKDSEKILTEQVEKGAGLLMVGGWGSFSGPFGGWKNSLIEELLPVNCSGHDDRLNFPGGALVLPKEPSPFSLAGFNSPPVICGLNRVRPKKDSRVVLTARRIEVSSKRGRLAPTLRLAHEYPLLVLDPRRKTAALTTDLAPHWCGGLVDWGRKRLRLHVQDEIWIEVGDFYVRLVSSLLRWLG